MKAYDGGGCRTKLMQYSAIYHEILMDFAGEDMTKLWKERR